jgi:hypothetical protein
MKVQGCDCSITIKTTYREFNVPYSDETLREAVSLLVEDSAIEGDGVCKAIRKNSGTTGCVITPLIIGTTPHLLYLVMGYAGNLEFVSETRNLYKYQLSLLPMEDTELFDLIQDRGGERKLYEGCRVKGFELRVMRDEAIKLKFDIIGERSPITYPYADIFKHEGGERFYGDNVSYKINGQEFKNIYGVTLTSKKEGGTRTEMWIKRALEQGSELPHIIDEMIITAQLLRDKYEYRHFGTFRITLKKLVLTCDETNINSADIVIGPLRYYVADTVSAEVFTSSEETIR